VVIGGVGVRVTARLVMTERKFEEKMDMQAAPAPCRTPVGSAVVRLWEAVYARA